MDKLSDELIKQIATGSGRCYNHEGKKMAQEILGWRAAAAKAAAAASGTGVSNVGQPFPFHP